MLICLNEARLCATFSVSLKGVRWGGSEVTVILKVTC